MQLTTKEILAFRSLNRPIDKNWIDWAVTMLEKGHDTKHLCILAGESTPYEYKQFELIELVDITFEELGLTYSDKDLVIKEYVAEFLQYMLNGVRTSQEVLRELRDLYIELDYIDYLSDFYYLSYAQGDLLIADVQYYWPEATRSNIENIIQQVSRNWIDNLEIQV